MKLIKMLSVAASLLLILSTFTMESCEDHQTPGEPGQIPQELSSRIAYILTNENTVYEIDVAHPEIIGAPIRIDTRQIGEKVLAIDFRPATGQLYAISDYATAYLVNTDENRIVDSYPFNSKTELEVDYTARVYGFDFNPVTDRMRIVTEKGENVSLEPIFGMADNRQQNPRGISTPNVAAIAYSNNFSGASSTTLYGMDASSDKLIRYLNQDASAINVVGDFGANIDEVGGFDISPRNRNAPEYGVASVRIGNRWELDYVDLETGVLRKIGNLPDKQILGLAIPTPVAYATDKHGKLLAFNPVDKFDEDPARLISVKQITGITPGDSILGIDLSVSYTSKLYAIASDNKIYSIDPTNGKALLEAEPEVQLNLTATGAFGVDLDPYNNRLRVVAGTQQNLSFNVESNDKPVAYNSFIYNGRQQALDGIAFSNNQAVLTRSDRTLLYGIDSQTRNLFKWDTVYNELNLVGQLDPMFSKFNGFDIGGYFERGYGVFEVRGRMRLYEISLSSGTIVRELSEIPYDVRGFTLGRYVFNKIP